MTLVGGECFCNLGKCLAFILIFLFTGTKATEFFFSVFFKWFLQSSSSGKQLLQPLWLWATQDKWREQKGNSSMAEGRNPAVFVLFLLCSGDSRWWGKRTRPSLPSNELCILCHTLQEILLVMTLLITVLHKWIPVYSPKVLLSDRRPSLFLSFGVYTYVLQAVIQVRRINLKKKKFRSVTDCEQWASTSRHFGCTVCMNILFIPGKKCTPCSWETKRT